MTTEEIAQHIGISQRAIEKQIDKLKREGNLHQVGPNKGGYGRVLGHLDDL